jgi:hypothetical protein
MDETGAWVLMASRGSYDDLQEWPVTVFLDEGTAERCLREYNEPGDKIDELVRAAKLLHDHWRRKTKPAPSMEEIKYHWTESVLPFIRKRVDTNYSLVKVVITR